MRALIVIVAVCVVGLAGMAEASRTRGVLVLDNYYSPKTKTVKRGDVVRFSWSRADNEHDVVFTSAPRGARKPRRCRLQSSGTCRRKLRRRGTYRYVCSVHLESDNMRGKVVVRR